MKSVLSCSQLPPEILYEQIALAPETRGFVVLPSALPLNVADGLLDHLAVLDKKEFHHATIGRGESQVHNNFVRRDKITWIYPNDPLAVQWHAWANGLQQYLNRRLFLGLFSFESHFAYYQKGDFYQKHLDVFQGHSNRILSLATYLNRDWLPEQGGELVIYDSKGDELVKVTPGFGTLVVFLSEEFPHEVLRAKRSRLSVAGWFRVNTSSAERADPPV